MRLGVFGDDCVRIVAGFIGVASAFITVLLEGSPMKLHCFAVLCHVSNGQRELLLLRLHLFLCQGSLIDLLQTCHKIEVFNFEGFVHGHGLCVEVFVDVPVEEP